MIKSIDTKFSWPAQLLIFFVLFYCLSGCGGSPDTATSTSTGSGVAISSFTGSPTSLAGGDSSILTVKVTDSLGAALIGKTVNFGFVTNNSGGTLPVSVGTTDASGQVVGVYTAGTTTPALSLEDTVKATCEGTTGVLIITRTAGTSSGLRVSLSVASTSLTAGQSSIITATVTNASGVAIQGETVTFSKFIDNSLMGLQALGGANLLTATTDASGQAVAVYTAGTNNPTANVQDTVQAGVSSGSYGAVIITRTGTASSTTTAAGYIMNVKASVTSLAAGQQSIITATVTDSSNKAVSGLPVTFSLVTNNSGVPTLSVVSGTTDASGSVSTVYTAGTGSSGTSVQDTVQASVNSGGYTSSGAVIITRTATSTTSAGLKMVFAATPSSEAAGQHSILTATVTDGSGVAVKGLTVNFTIVTNNSGAPALSVISGTTDASGQAVAIYTAGSTSPTANVQDTVQATVTSGGYSSSGAVIITRAGTSNTTPAGYIMNVKASVTSLGAGQQSIITATVTDGSNNVVSGLPVTFSLVTNNSSAPALSVVSGTTDASGSVSTVYTAGSGSSGTSVQDTVQASVASGGYSSSADVIITRTATSTTSAGLKMVFTATSSSVAAGQLSILTATVTDGSGAPVKGLTVNFSIVTNNSGATLSALSTTTDASGRFSSIYTAGSNSAGTSVQDTISANVSSGGYSSAEAVIITRTATPGLQISSFVGAPTALEVGQSSILTVKVIDSNGNAVSGKTVNFGFVTNNSGGTLPVSVGTTDASGQAVGVYTAGTTTPALSLEDTIQATCNGTAGVLIITRTATTSSGNKITLMTASTSLTSGQSSIITATVTNASGVPVQGAAVTFTKLIDNSTMGLITLGTGTTDAGGQAVAVYTAGTNTPNVDVQDTVEASVSGGSYGAVIITRKASFSSSTAGYIMNVSASVTSLAAGQQSIITAKVTDGAGNKASGLPVTFSLVTNNSGVPTLSVASGTTDASGSVSTVYTAGSGSSGTSVQDTVQASVSSGGYSSAADVIITRTATSTTSAGLKMVFAATPSSEAAGQHSILTATVTNGSGIAVQGLTVNFSIVTNNSGAPALSVISGTTDASGQAVAVYTAGSTNPTANVQDTVQATVTSGGYSSSGAALITRTGTSNTTPAGYIMNVKASVTSLGAGQQSIITATVTDGSNNVVSGLPVTFSLATNNSSAPALSVVSGTTDASGSVSTVYTAGSGSSGTSVQDTVQASVASGGYSSSADVIITRTATSTTAAGLKMVFTATPSSLSAGQFSILTATVTDGSGVAVKGLTVNFAFLTNNSSAPALSAVSATTDASGQALAVYTAGSNSAGTSVQDTIRASASSGGYSSAGVVIITRTGTTSGLQISSFVGAPTALGAGQSSILTFKITDSTGAAVSGKTVHFGFVTNNSGGTLPVSVGTTDASGQAVGVYTAGTNTPALSLEDTIYATCEGYAGVLIITRTAGSPLGLNITISATVTSLAAGQSSIITAIVTNSSGAPVAGETVTFVKLIDTSTMTLAALGGGLTATTDASGKAVAVYTAGSTNPTADVQDTVSASVNSGASYGAVVITRTGTASTSVTPTGYQVTLTASSLSLEAGDHSIITATVKNGSGNIASGLPVSFSIASNSGGTLSVTSGTTDASGGVSTVYTAGSNLSGSVQDVISVNVNSGASYGDIIITRTATSSSAAGYKMTFVSECSTGSGSCYSLSAGNYCILTATVTDGLGAPVKNMTVNIYIYQNNSGATLYPLSGQTDASGRFSTTYMAGSTPSQDVIYATVTSGSYSAAEAIIMTVTATSGSSGSTTGKASLTLVLTDNVVSYGTPVTAYATLRDANGALVPNAVVTFAATSNLVTFTPTSATALTNASGVAVISINSADISSAGATSITASAQLTSGTTTTTVTSAPVGIAVNGATVTLGSITLGQPSISAYGTSSVNVPVLINGLPSTVPMSVAFTSPCVAAGKATLTNPVTSIGGTATSTYKDNGCGTATDVITASVTGDTASATIIVAVPATNNIQFISATPAIIGTSTASAPTLMHSSVVKFQVVDTNNNGKAGVVVDFTLKPSSAPGGITLTPTSATSDSSGYVTTALTSGTVPTPVWVVATIHGTSLTSQSNTLTITTGLPTQNFFSLSASTHNIEGWGYDGTTSTITIIASDRLGNPIPDGTVINFISEGGHIDDNGATSPPASYGVCKTSDGICTVTFKSAAYRPIDETIDYGGTIGVQGAVAALDGLGNPITINGGDPLYVKNGRVTVLAYTLGEMSFVDSHGTNAYQSDDTFYDLGQLFLDSNENGILDTNTSQPNLQEQTIGNAPGTSACGTHIGGSATATPYCTIINGICTDYTPSDYATAPSVQNSCSGVWGQTYVRRSGVIILSGSFAQVSQSKFPTAGTCFATYSFWLMDENYNPMPAGTTVAINTGSSNVNYTYMSVGPPAQIVGAPAALNVAGSPVPDTIHAGGTPVTLIISGGAGCDGAVAAGTIIDYPIGPVAIDVTSPKGNVSTITFNIK